MQFTQIIEFETSRLDEMLAKQQEWAEMAQDSPTTVDVQFCQDRDNPMHCVVIATFESYEEAMKNNDAPETQQGAEMMAKLANGAPKFINLNVLQTSSV